MTQLKLSMNAKFEKRLRAMAVEYKITMSDIVNEMAEWTLDQEKQFRKDLEESLELEDEDEDEDESEEETEKEAE